LCLISTSLRGPFSQNPWRRKAITAVTAAVAVPAAVNNEVEPTSPVKRRVKKQSARKTGGKETKVDQYFNAQKNSQERDLIMKKKTDLEKCPVEREDPILFDSEETLLGLHGGNTGLGIRCDGYEDRENTVEPLRAVPRLIDFDQIPPSTDMDTQNYPSLHLFSPKRRRGPTVPLQYFGSARCTDNEAAEDDNAEDDGKLFDAPTPEMMVTSKQIVQEPTARDLESIRNLLGDEQPHDIVPPNKADDDALYDPPTPTPNSHPRELPTRNSSLSDSILPASLRLPRFSPIKSGTLPLLPKSTTPLSPSRNINHFPSENLPSSSPLRRSLSLQTPSRPLAVSPQLQRTQSANAACTPPLNTQHMLDLANQSFNAILPTPSPSSLLPSAQFGPPNPSTSPSAAPLPSGFTPFKALRGSPAMSDKNSAVEGVSFKLADSPLTYSPTIEDALRGDIMFLGAWSLEDELEKLKTMEIVQEGQEDGARESQGKSQECAVGA